MRTRLFSTAEGGPRLMVVMLLLGLAASSLILGQTSGRLSTLNPLPPLTGDAPAVGESAWQFSTVAAVDWPESLRKLSRRGSWVGGDAFVGEHSSGWFQARDGSAIALTGYPRLGSNLIEIEVRQSDGRSTTIPFVGENPGERWIVWKLPLPSGADGFRIHARDGMTGPRGWLAFSEPFTAPIHRTFDFRGTAQTLAAVALVLVLVLGPGLIWRGVHARSLLSVLWPGPLWLALGGCVCWLLGGLVAPRFVALGWVGLTLSALAALGLRHRVWRAWTPLETRLLALIAIVVLGTTAKAAFSGGPKGELYAGSISRTLEVGDRSDSRISYHTVQIVAHHLAPREPEASKYFAPWDFSGRGPLAGLTAAPIVLATGGRPPLGMPDLPWSPFDREGFAAYRIVMIALSAMSLIAITALLLRVADERRAWIGVGLVGLTPFFWHELYFSWPKLAASACVLGSFHGVLDRRAFRAALWVVGGFLCHPLALLSVPLLGLWILLQSSSDVRRGLVHGAVFGTGVLAGVFAWHLVTGFHPSQGGFLQYARAADGLYDISPSAWWLSRWQSFANTFIPFHPILSNAARAPFDMSDMQHGGVVRFFFQYWTSAPFAAGLLTVLVASPAFFFALVRRLGVALLTVIGPGLLLLLYWGVTTTGLMREGAHVVFLSAWIFLAWAGAERLPAVLFSRAFIALRGIEVLAMMFVPALVAGVWQINWLLNDVWWLAVSTACVGATVWMLQRHRFNAPSCDPQH